MTKIFREILHKGLVQEIRIKRNIVDKKSRFQRIQIFDSYIYGRVLALDGIIQITEKDESSYSEMLVHPAINKLKNPKNILIIGGGDGAVAEELLKYNFIKTIDLVDIDKEVINLSKKYFKKINKNSLTNKKVKIFTEDALFFTKESKKKYDLVIADRPDPVGAGKSLFKYAFYENIKKILNANGIAVFQSGVPFLQQKELKEVCNYIEGIFKNSGIILTVVPSYIGGYMALVWASNRIKLGGDSKKYIKTKLATEYYNLKVCSASFCIPNFIEKMK